MAQQKIKKLIFCTLAGVEDDPNKLWLYRHIAKPFFLQKGYENRQAAEKIIAHSDTDWILVRPGRLTSGKLTTNFRVSERFRVAGGYSISRADVAFFILQQVNNNKWVHKTPTLSLLAPSMKLCIGSFR